MTRALFRAPPTNRRVWLSKTDVSTNSPGNPLANNTPSGPPRPQTED